MLMEMSSDGSDSDFDPEHEEEMIQVENRIMAEDVYGFALTSLIRDSRMLASAHGDSCLRISRLIASQLFCLAHIFTLAWLLMETQRLVTSKHIQDTRELYDKYEFHMYGSMESHTELTVHGNHRGLAGFFQPELFDTLDPAIMDEICVISLSCPNFFMVILSIWTLTCLGEVQACGSMAWSVFALPTISTMKHALIGLPKYDFAYKLKNKLPPRLQERVEALGPNDRLVIGLTMRCKLYVLLCIALPRFCMTVYLLWLGCRWLLATSGFENVLLNGVALEFILVLKNLLYTTVVPLRNKKDVQCTQMIPAKGSLTERASYMTMLGSFGWYLLAIGWAYAYTFYLQGVIPGYRWDVSGPCEKYVARHFTMI